MYTVYVCKVTGRVGVRIHPLDFTNVYSCTCAFMSSRSIARNTGGRSVWNHGVYASKNGILSSVLSSIGGHCTVRLFISLLSSEATLLFFFCVPYQGFWLLRTSLHILWNMIVSDWYWSTNLDFVVRLCSTDRYDT